MGVASPVTTPVTASLGSSSDDMVLLLDWIGLIVGIVSVFLWISVFVSFRFGYLQGFGCLQGLISMEGS